MKKIIFCIALVLAAVSCEKKAEYNQTLGLLSEYNILSENGGSTQVAVFSNTNWSVELDHPVSWASIDRFNGYKSGYLVFDYEINYGRARRVILVFTAGGKTMTLNMYQKARLSDSDCVMTMTPEGGSSSLIVPAEGKTETIGFNTNLVYELNEMYLTLTYPEGEEPETPWISLKRVELDKVTLEIAPNTTGAVRTANVKITHTDAGSYDSTEGDTIYSNTLTVAQTK